MYFVASDKWANHRVTTCEYDSLGRLTKVEDSLAGIASVEYDKSGNATAFGKSAVDFYVRHEGIFFTSDFRRSMEDVGDFLAMLISGAGMGMSAKTLAGGIHGAADSIQN